MFRQPLSSSFLSLVTLGVFGAAGVSACGAVSENGPSSLDPVQPDLGGEPSLGGEVRGGQTGQETTLAPGCEKAVSSDHALSEITPTGFSGQGLVDAVSGPLTQTFEWPSRDLTQATLTVEAVMGQARFFGVAGSPAESACPGELSVPAWLTLQTDDGQLDERWQVVVRASQLTDVQVLSSQPITSFSGTLVPQGLDLRDGERVDSYSVWLSYVSLESVAVKGELTANIQSVPTDPDGALVQVRPVLLGKFSESQ